MHGEIYCGAEEYTNPNGGQTSRDSIWLAEGEEETFSYHSVSTTNSSGRFDGEYKLFKQARGSVGSIVTYAGLDVGKVSSIGSRQQPLIYRKLVDKSEINKCEKLPRLFFDYCNLVNRFDLAVGEKSPIANIIKSVHVKPFRFGLTSKDVVYAELFGSFTGDTISKLKNRHNSLFLSDKDISDLRTMLDTIPETAGTPGFALDKNRPSLWGPLGENEEAFYDSKSPGWRDTYIRDFYADKYGSMYKPDFDDIIDTFDAFLRERFGINIVNFSDPFAYPRFTRTVNLEILGRLMFEHKNGINGNASGFASPNVGGVINTILPNTNGDDECGIFNYDIQFPPGGAAVFERSRFFDSISTMQASLGMQIYTAKELFDINNFNDSFDDVRFYRPILPEIGSFDFTLNQNNKYLGFETFNGANWTPRGSFWESSIGDMGQIPGFELGKIESRLKNKNRIFGFDDDETLVGYEPDPFSPIGFAPLPRVPYLGYTAKFKTVPLSEYFFVIGDARDEF